MECGRRWHPTCSYLALEPGNLTGGTVMMRQPWYRERNVWLWSVAVILPLGWILPLCRMAWVQNRSRRSVRLLGRR